MSTPRFLHQLEQLRRHCLELGIQLDDITIDLDPLDWRDLVSSEFIRHASQPVYYQFVYTGRGKLFGFNVQLRRGHDDRMV